MRDEQIGRAELALDADQQVDDLGPGGRIERRGRLVEHDQLAARVIIARAMPTRCCWPMLISAG